MPRYGLIGYPLSHSFSERYFSEKFKREGLTDHHYQNFPIEDVSDLRSFFADKNLSGFNITIPHKEAVIQFLDRQSDVVKEIGACNCVDIRDDIWTGYNTDVEGFRQSLLPLLKLHHKKALLLGSGGASKAIRWVLNKLGIEYIIVSTSIKKEGFIGYDELNKEIINDHLLIINSTPVGTYPNGDACPNIPYEYLTPKHYLFDVVYNPEKSLFLKKGEEKGAAIKNGYQMLEIQADESWKIWKKSFEF